MSVNLEEGTLRGFHIQRSPHGEQKTLTVIEGAVYDVVIDLRKDSPTYLKSWSAELSQDTDYSLTVPKGCANAFLTLQPDTRVIYFVDEFYHPQSEIGIRYNDPTLNIRWPFEPKVISDKDRNHPDFDLATWNE